MSLMDLETQRQRLRRLRILQVLSMNGIDPIGEGLILKCLSADEDLAFTADNIRSNLDYLEERRLVHITLRTTDRWIAKLSANGRDFLEGIGPKIEGVAHPEEF